MDQDKLGFRGRFRIRAAVIVLLWLYASAAADDAASIWGRLKSVDGAPGRNLQVVLTAKERNFSRAIETDDVGFFSSAGLPIGRYGLRIEGKTFPGLPAEKEIVLPMPQTYFLEITVPEKAGDGGMTVKLMSPDFPLSPHQTFIGREQLDRLPSGNDVWTVIENQDFSATMNRIDVGGMWAARPGLFSARGGGSWTQTAYRLNGVDVTDPYQPGMPLLWPDPFTLDYMRLVNSAPPLWISSPGGVLDLKTEEGGRELQGSMSVFGTGKPFHSDNITPALREEGIRESHSLDFGLEGNFRLSGPVLKDKLYLFTSWTSFNFVRNPADYEKADRSYLASGLVHLSYLMPRGRLKFLWAGQRIQEPSFGAGRGVPFTATSDRDTAYDAVQAVWEGRLADRHFLSAGASYNRGRLVSGFQEGASGYHEVEILRNSPAGPAEAASESVRSSLILFARGTSLFSGRASNYHRLDYGLELRSTEADTTERVMGGRHLRFYRGKALELVEFDRPSFSHREKGLVLTAAVQERLTFVHFLSLSAELNLSSCFGQPRSSGQAGSFTPAAENRIRWTNLSPRLSLTIPLWGARTAALQITAGCYFYGMPLQFLTYGHPGAPGALAYAWDDANGDSRFQDGEKGRLLRREGPAYGKIDPDLKRPFTDAYSVSFHQGLGRGWQLGLAGFYRETHNTVESVNSGVPFSAYDPVDIYDPGDDLLSGTHDDLTFTVYNQRFETLGRDFFLLTNPSSPLKPVTRYRGLDLTIVKPFGDKGGFFIAATATEAVGLTSPGNSEWENDDGIPGSLYDNPNSLINTKGRVRFDRAYVVRCGLAFDGPAGTKIAVLGKYYDGQPFARWIVVEGLNQGPFSIMAHPRGVARYEFNMTWDVRVEKTFGRAGSRLRLILDGFNIFNQHLATAENPWTGPDWPLRFASEIQSPRIFRLGIAYEF